MKNFVKRIHWAIPVVLSVVAVVTYVLYPRAPFQVPDGIGADIIISAGYPSWERGKDVTYSDISNYILENDSMLLSPTESQYNSGSLFLFDDSRVKFDSEFRSPDGRYAVRGTSLINPNGERVRSGIPLGIKYWTPDSRYLVYLDHAFAKQGLLTVAHYSEYSVQIMELETGMIQQITFRNLERPGQELIGILGVAK